MGCIGQYINKNVPCGGYCPEDRRAEDGVIEDKYPLTPLAEVGYRKRTRQNIIDSDDNHHLLGLITQKIARN